MARAKKNDPALTLEEKLEQVLVPNWDLPYRIPRNWCWVTLESVASLHNGDRGVNYPSKKDYVEIGIPFINAGAIQNNTLDESEFNYITEGKYESLRAGKIQEGDILYCLRGSLGKTAVVESDTKGAISSSLCILRCNEAVLRRYIAYLLRSEVIHKQQEMAENGSAQPNLSAASVLKYMLPIPPLAEQQRIVNRIESLFAKLDEAKEKAQATLDNFETRKAAILHKAFAGELTANWRTERNINLDSWYTAPLSHISTLQTGLMKGKKYGQRTVNMPYLRVANVQDGFLDLGEIKEIEVSVDQTERYKLRVGDVLFTEGGDFDKLGRGTVWEGQIANCLHQNHIFVVRPDPEILDPYFLSYQAGSKYGKDYFVSCAKQTTNLASINSTQLKSFPVLIPTMGEQVRIVEIIRELLDKEQQARCAAEVVVAQTELIKKSILSRAFRGELGTNDPMEKSALELLKSILVDKKQEVEDKPSKKRLVIPDEVAALLSSNLEKELIKVFYKEDGDLVPMSKLMAVSSKKFEVIGAIKKLQQKGIIQKTDNGDFKLMR